MNLQKKPEIGVIGDADERFLIERTINVCKDVGRELAKRKVLLITGGLGGVMKYVSQGAKENGGTTIGILPLCEKGNMNEYVDIPIVGVEWGTRNIILVYSCDAIIMIGGGSGTLNEVSLACMLEKPIVAIKNTGGWADKLAGKFLDGRKKTKIEIAHTAKEAVEIAIERALKKGDKSATCP